MYNDITEGKVIPSIAKQEVGAKMHPLIVGNSAFPCKTWLMKPYTNDILSEGQDGDRRGLWKAQGVLEGIDEKV